MAYLMAPQPPKSTLPVFYNVDGTVGAPPASNKPEDVMLVQFAFSIIGKQPDQNTDPALTAAAKTIRVTGSIDTTTVNAIRVHQQCTKKNRPGQVVDGRVSSAKGGYSFGGGIWTICYLNNSLQNRYYDIWPRIDMIPGCPGLLQQMVVRTVAGEPYHP